MTFNSTDKVYDGNMALSANLDLRKTVSNIPIIDLFLNQVIVQSISPM